jgi:hypothetical protein
MACSGTALLFFLVPQVPQFEKVVSQFEKVESQFEKVVVVRRVCGELLSKGRQWAVTWWTTGREWVARPGDTRGVACLGVVTLTKRLDTAWD